MSPYESKLQGLINDPSSYSKTPGFKFALDTGLQGVSRANSKNRASGNALAELTRYGTGLAEQGYGAEVDRLGRLTGQDQQYQLGAESNSINRMRAGNDFTLGTEQNRLSGVRDANNFDLGNRTLDETGRANDQRFGLGLYEASGRFDAQGRELDQAAQRDYWNYDLGRTRNVNDADRAYNDWMLNSERADIDAMNASTNRGNALGNWLKNRK